MTTIDMTRREGTQGVALVECTDKRRQTYIVRTDIQPKPTEESPDGVTFIQHQFDYKPAMADVKEFVLGVIDEQVKAKIIGGMVWNGKPVWYSIENQLNFSNAVAPVTLKIGEQADGTAVYEDFETAEQLAAFNAACNAHKQTVLTAGWRQKDGYDWTPYERELSAADE